MIRAPASKACWCNAWLAAAAASSCGYASSKTPSLAPSSCWASRAPNRRRWWQPCHRSIRRWLVTRSSVRSRAARSANRPRRSDWISMPSVRCSASSPSYCSPFLRFRNWTCTRCKRTAPKWWCWMPASHWLTPPSRPATDWRSAPILPNWRRVPGLKISAISCYARSGRKMNRLTSSSYCWSPMKTGTNASLPMWASWAMKSWLA